MGIEPIHVFLATLVAAIVIISFLGRIFQSLKKTNAILEKFLIEHEILIGDYCRRTGIKPEELPTRLRGLFKVS